MDSVKKDNNNRFHWLHTTGEMERVKKNNESQKHKTTSWRRRFSAMAIAARFQKIPKNEQTPPQISSISNKNKKWNANRTMLTHFRNVVESTLSHQLQREEKKKTTKIKQKPVFRYWNMHTSKWFIIKPQRLMSLCKIKTVSYHELLLNVKAYH